MDWIVRKELNNDLMLRSPKRDSILVPTGNVSAAIPPSRLSQTTRLSCLQEELSQLRQTIKDREGKVFV